jgi:hypothetical protein
MINKVLAAFVVANGVFVSMGALELGFCIIVRQTCFDIPTEGENAARNLLYQKFPFNAGIVNAALTFLIFLVTLPGMITGSRLWLKIAGYMTVIDAIFTMAIGLQLWIITLKMRDEFSGIWNSQPGGIQDVMQSAFQCCGYHNSTAPAFVTNPICPSPAAAALMRGCASPLVSFGNEFIDNIFTAVFGMVGIQVILIVTMACLLKDRKERERFRHIDEKMGVAGGF